MPNVSGPTLNRRRSIPSAVGAFLRGVDLTLVLPPCDGAVRIDHTRGDVQTAVGDPLRAHHHGDAGKSCGIRHRGPRALEESGIKRRCLRKLGVYGPRRRASTRVPRRAPSSLGGMRLTRYKLVKSTALI
jgi:hypothetical protein